MARAREDDRLRDFHLRHNGYSTPSRMVILSSDCSCRHATSWGPGGDGIVVLERCPLHSAAPDLLAACEAALSVIHEATGKGSSEYRRLEAAIAKARGEAS